MITEIWATISGAFVAVGKIFGWASGQATLRNTAQMQNAATAQKENNADDQTAKDIANRNTDSVRNDLST